MRIALSKEQCRRIRDAVAVHPDAEAIAPDDYVLDLYDAETPMSLEIVFSKDGIDVLAAEALSFDDAMDGWYLSGAITQEDVLTNALTGLLTNPS